MQPDLLAIRHRSILASGLKVWTEAVGPFDNHRIRDRTIWPGLGHPIEADDLKRDSRLAGGAHRHEEPDLALRPHDAPAGSVAACPRSGA